MEYRGRRGRKACSKLRHQSNEVNTPCYALIRVTLYPSGIARFDLLCKRFRSTRPLRMRQMRSSYPATYSVHAKTYEEFKILAKAATISSSSEDTNATCSCHELDAYMTNAQRSLATMLAPSFLGLGPAISLELRYCEQDIKILLWPARFSIANSGAWSNFSRSSLAVWWIIWTWALLWTWTS